MSPEIHSQLTELRERVQRLERRPSKRGSCTQRKAASTTSAAAAVLYRQLHLQGKGPRRNPDGTYSYDNLDAYLEQGATD